MPGGLIHTTDFDTGCVRALDAVGNTATLAAVTSCNDRAFDPNFSQNYNLFITPNTETLTYRGGRSMTESATTSLRYTYEDGFVLDCTSTISGVSLTR